MLTTWIVECKALTESLVIYRSIRLLTICAFLLWISHLILLSCHSGSSVTLKESDLIILLDLLRSAAPQWRTVGLALGFQDFELTTIEQKPSLISEGPPGYFREMLSQWLKWAPPKHSWPTLEALQHALQSYGHESLAVNLIPEFIQRLRGNVSHYQC